MNKFKKIVKILIILIFVAGLGFLGLSYLASQKAGILVESVPSASVFINGEEVGKTPYKGAFKPGEITIRLIPEAFDKPLSPYEAKLTLTVGVKTVLRRTFGETIETSSGEQISYEKSGDKSASLAIVSIPDALALKVDGEPKGFTPIKLDNLSSGEHKITLSAPGYETREFSVLTRERYRLTCVVSLAKTNEPVDVVKGDTQEKQEEKKEEIFVEILSTPVGFLRVREEPSTISKEVGRVEPGKKYKFIEEDQKSGWFKIEYAEGGQGWVSDEYAKVLDG